METSTPIIDIHVHSTLKPYGNSFYSNSNKRSITDASCVWFSDKDSISDNVFENVIGISRYRQSDFSILANNQHKIVCVSLYPIEKEFIDVKNINSISIEKFLAQFASLLGKNRVENIKSKEYNYFKDFNLEYEYLLELDNQTPIGSSKKYKFIDSNFDLNLNVKSDANLFIIPSVEGCHFLCDGNNPRDLTQWKNLEANILKIKELKYPLFYVTFAHHFYNGLCTHSKSLFDMSGNLLDQKYGMREHKIIHTDDEPPITPIGYQMIDLLLSKENGKRILIDVKHMSVEARTEFYKILNSEKYINDKIPIIYSHGAVSIGNNEIIENNQLNLNKDDLIQIYKSSGIIGIEIDQRILGYNKNRFLKWIKNLIKNKDKQSYKEAAYFWDQIKLIAEFAYINGYKNNPWEFICLGSDYDGVINPLNSYRDSGKMSTLYINLISYLNDYWSNNPLIPRNLGNQDAQDVIYAIMYKNAFEFIEKHYLDELVV